MNSAHCKLRIQKHQVVEYDFETAQIFLELDLTFALHTKKVMSCP